MQYKKHKVRHAFVVACTFCVPVIGYYSIFLRKLGANKQEVTPFKNPYIHQLTRLTLCNLCYVVVLCE